MVFIIHCAFTNPSVTLISNHFDANYLNLSVQCTLFAKLFCTKKQKLRFMNHEVLAVKANATANTTEICCMRWDITRNDDTIHVISPNVVDYKLHQDATRKIANTAHSIYSITSCSTNTYYIKIVIFRSI